jgi:fermentation-respiration switch protein FrsA (DUF1100 family)
MRQMLLVALAIVGLMLLLIWLGQRRMIYLPFDGNPSPAAYGLPDAQVVTLTTEDGLELQAWFVRPTRAPTGITVVVFNGNAGHRGYRAPLARALADRGVATLLFDYRGYGGNPGGPSEAGLMRDARAARAWIDAQPGVDATKIAYLGESLGTGVAVQLAASHPPAALMLRSPYTSLVDVGRHHYPILPVGLLLRDRFSSIDWIARLHAPVLVIAGEHDRIIPRQSSERLFAAANEPKQLVIIPGADHNDMSLLAGAQMLDAIVDFLTRTVTGTQTR